MIHEMGVREVPRMDRGRWRGSKTFPKPNGSKQCLRDVCGNVCGKALFIPGRGHCSTRVACGSAGRVREGCAGLLYTPVGATVERTRRGHCSTTVTRRTVPQRSAGQVTRTVAQRSCPGTPAARLGTPSARPVARGQGTVAADCVRENLERGQLARLFLEVSRVILADGFSL